MSTPEPFTISTITTTATGVTMSTVTSNRSEHIAAAAAWAGRMLKNTGRAAVQLTPGDATRYDVVVTLVDSLWIGSSGVDAAMQGAVVTLANFNTSCYWSGTYMTPQYAADKLGNGSRVTGSVMAEFLNGLAEHVPADLLRRSNLG